MNLNFDTYNGKITGALLLTPLAGIVFHTFSAWRKLRKLQQETNYEFPVAWKSLCVPVLNDACFVFHHDHYQHFSRRHEEYGDVYITSLAGSPTLVCGNASLASYLFDRKNKLVWSPPVSIGGLKKLIGGGVSQSVGKDHASARSLIVKYFGKKNLHKNFVWMRYIFQRSLDEFAESAGGDITPVFEDAVWTAMILLLFGEEHDVNPGVLVELRECIACITVNLAKPAINIPGFGHYRARKAKAKFILIIKDIVNDAVNENSRDYYVSENFEPKSFLESLIRHMVRAGRAEINYDQCISAFLASVDTTKTTSGWMAYFLCKNPDVVEKVREEANRELGADGILSNNVTWELILNKMKYTQAVVKESTLQASFLPFTFKGTDSRVFLGESFGNGAVPAHTKLVFTWLRMKEGAFGFQNGNLPVQPERYLNDSLSEDFKLELARDISHTFTYAFGFGPRACPGQYLATFELTLFCIIMSQSHDWELKEEPAKLVSIPLRYPESGIHIRAKKK